MDNRCFSTPVREPLNMPVAEHIEMAMRKIAAEAYLTEALFSEHLARRIYPSPIDYEPLRTHLRFIKREISDYATGTSSGVILDELRRIEDKTAAWISNIGGELSFEKLADSSQAFFYELDLFFQSLNCRASLHPKGLNNREIQLLEFDSEFSGVCHQLTNQIVSLEKELLIDPNLGHPQEGYARIESSDEIIRALGLKESRLFALLKDRKLEGFYIQELNSATVRREHANLCLMLENEQILDSHQRVGYARIVGIRRATRRENIRQGYDLYQSLDSAMVATAKSEGIDLLIGLAREGANANTSIASHQRVGWEVTPCTVLGEDNITPYRVLIRPLSYPDGKPDRLFLGHNSHFQRWDNQLSLRTSGIEQAQTISPSTAINYCHDFFRELKLPIQINYTHGAYAFYMTITDAHLKSITHNLHQLRPRTDYWHYFNEQQLHGPLSEVLPHVASNLRNSGNKYCYDF